MVNDGEERANLTPGLRALSMAVVGRITRPIHFLSHSRYNTMSRGGCDPMSEVRGVCDDPRRSQRD
jgi:hypothetical protein